jgi:hypothetical protein
VKSGNIYLKRIAALSGEEDPNSAIKLFVAPHRKADEPLDVLACKLGVSRIIEQRMPFEGGLFQLPDGELVIKLNSENSYVRKRFTLAHEIGHLLLNSVPALKSSNRTDESLERACDLIAAELLMPMDEIVPFVEKLGGPSPEKLKIIASRFAVSLRAAAIRVHSGLKLWKCYIGFWERRELVRTVWFVGRKRWDTAIPDSYSLDLAVDSGKSVQASELWTRDGFSDPVRLYLLSMGVSKTPESQQFLGLVNFLN